MDTVQVKEYFEGRINLSNGMSIVASGIQTLIEVIRQSDVSTIVELREILLNAIGSMKTSELSNASLLSGGELFMRFITLASLDQSNFSDAKQVLIERGEQYLRKVESSRRRIVHLALPFIAHGSKILLHSRSNVVLELLKQAVETGRDFSCFVTESCPNKSGVEMYHDLVKANINASLILDAQAAVVMESVDMVILGAEAVTESGGIINKIGTYSLCLCAHTLQVPVYVMVESCKFLRTFPLNQADLDPEFKYPPSARRRTQSGKSELTPFPLADYTPPQYLTLLITDLGALPPSAVSDELIKLYL